ncbi:hypothetical protein [Ligilactobacillus ceti]|uniref:Uncharacterized protein n=1 Tax=Ligilactobacillus ceti DSM 22408 TaxID=1122146 RepID=A0A0R2KHK1_9LACO|nr:hypothetical protein [Ligilactobacillus ceti]KRN88850.1 hypothetical protein IV53_GL000820 [Ligilactobacillus ceti DSM 22408]
MIIIDRGILPPDCRIVAEHELLRVEDNKTDRKIAEMYFKKPGKIFYTEEEDCPTAPEDAVTRLLLIHFFEACRQQKIRLLAGYAIVNFRMHNDNPDTIYMFRKKSLKKGWEAIAHIENRTEIVTDKKYLRLVDRKALKALNVFAQVVDWETMDYINELVQADKLVFTQGLSIIRENNRLYLTEYKDEEVKILNAVRYNLTSNLTASKEELITLKEEVKPLFDENPHAGRFLVEYLISLADNGLNLPDLYRIEHAIINQNDCYALYQPDEQEPLAIYDVDQDENYFKEDIANFDNPEEYQAIKAFELLINSCVFGNHE